MEWARKSEWANYENYFLYIFLAATRRSFQTAISRLKRSYKWLRCTNTERFWRFHYSIYNPFWKFSAGPWHKTNFAERRENTWSNRSCQEKSISRKLDGSYKTGWPSGVPVSHSREYFVQNFVSLLTSAFVTTNRACKFLDEIDRTRKSFDAHIIYNIVSRDSSLSARCRLFTRKEISAFRSRLWSPISRNLDITSSKSEPRKPHLRLAQGGNACIKEGNTHVNGCAC